LTQAVGTNQPQQQALAQAAVGNYDVRRRPNPGDCGKYRATRQNELDPVGTDARVLR